MMSLKPLAISHNAERNTRFGACLVEVVYSSVLLDSRLLGWSGMQQAFRYSLNQFCKNPPPFRAVELGAEAQGWEPITIRGRTRRPLLPAITKARIFGQEGNFSFFFSAARHVI